MEKIIWPLIAIAGMGSGFALLLTAAYFLLPPARQDREDGASKD